MKVKYVTDDQLWLITEEVSEAKYDNNVKVDTAATGFRLRVRDSRGPGARRAASGSGRRTVSACWHAHRDVMLEIFRRHPNARITTMIADYNGATDFEEKYPQTAFHNIGSEMRPSYMPALCECGGNTPAAISEIRRGAIAAFDAEYMRPPPPRAVVSPSADAHRWTPENAEEELAEWDDFVSSIKAKTRRIVER